MSLFLFLDDRIHSRARMTTVLVMPFFLSSYHSIPPKSRVSREIEILCHQFPYQPVNNRLTFIRSKMLKMIQACPAKFAYESWAIVQCAQSEQVASGFAAFGTGPSHSQPP